MEVTGTIVNVLPKQSGTSKTGKAWEKQEFILEVPGQYPKHILFATLGTEKIQRIMPNLIQGQVRTVFFDIDCREFNGKYYNDVSAYSVQMPRAQQGAPQGGYQGQPQYGYQSQRPTGQYQTIAQAPVASAPVVNAPQQAPTQAAQPDGEALPF